MYPDVYRDAGALDILADVSCLARFRDGRLQNARSQRELTPDIDVGRFRSDGVTGEDNAFQDLVRVPLDQLAVFEGTRFAFVRIAAQIAQALIILGQKSPFDPC